MVNFFASHAFSRQPDSCAINIALNDAYVYSSGVINYQKLGIGIAVLIAFIVLFTAVFSKNASESTLAYSREDVTEAFECDLETEEQRATDMYCDSYQLYLDHVRGAKNSTPEEIRKLFDCPKSLDPTSIKRPVEVYCVDQDAFIQETIDGRAAQYLRDAQGDPLNF